MIPEGYRMIPTKLEIIISEALWFAGSNSGALDTKAAKDKLNEASFKEKKMTKDMLDVFKNRDLMNEAFSNILLPPSNIAFLLSRERERSCYDK
jgi:hypothetical protein